MEPTNLLPAPPPHVEAVKLKLTSRTSAIAARKDGERARLQSMHNFLSEGGEGEKGRAGEKGPRTPDVTTGDRTTVSEGANLAYFPRKER